MPRQTELTAEERELRDNLVERMRKGGLDVVTDSEEMQRVIDTENERTRESRKRRSAGMQRFLRTAGGEVYGLVKDGRIYLDPKVATSETAVHEYTHLWGDMLRRKDSEQWSRTVKELKNSVLWEEVKELYPELKTDDEIADEVLSTFSGRRGAERLREEVRRVADGEGGVFTKAKAIETLERVKEAIARFWEGVARMFGINRYRSAEELADMAMRDLINGVKPTSRTFTFDNFYKDTKAVFEGTERPKGKPDYTSYSGSEYWYGEDKGGKYVVRGSDHWSGEFKVKDGERTNVGRNHYSEITEDGMLPIGAQGSLKFGWEKGLSKPVGSGISAAIDRRGSGDSNNIASCYWYIDNAKKKDNKGFTYGKAYLSEFEDKERRRNIPGDDWRDIQGLEGGTRNMFVGERGATEADHAEEVSVRLDNLSVAREMEAEKKDAKAIKMATGWERGADGKWRYEIPDLKYFGKGDAGYQKAREKQPWSKELDGLADRIFDGEDLSDSEYQRFDELAQKEDDFKTDYLNREKPHLADWVENDELFNAYPDLKRVEMVFTDLLPENVGGRYNEREHTIVVNTNYVGDIASVLGHEVQHAIQRIEGFAKGTTPEQAQGYDDYRRTAGEVEARNVQARMGMSAEERRASLAAETEDVARKDQIFLMGDGLSMPLGDGEREGESTTNEPETSYNSNRNRNFVSRYKTKDGKTISYTSENPEAYGVPGGEGGTAKGRGDRRQQSEPSIQRKNAALLSHPSERLNEAEGEYCAIERVFRESGYMDFTSAKKVKSADDVAFIFEELENASVENVFVVMTKRGVPTVLHISIGGFNWSAANAATVKMAYDRIKPDKVYFVHNHPSGSLKCSAPDVDCLKKIEGAIGKSAEGVIINLKSGKYGTFDSSSVWSSEEHDKAPAPTEQHRLRLYAFDRHVFNPDYQPSATILSSNDVAKFLSSHRLGDRKKISVLVCNNQNQIVANVHTTHTSIDSEGLADDIVRAIGDFGGMNAFLYGDFDWTSPFQTLAKAVQERSGEVFNLLDAVRVEGNNTWSARNQGLLYEPGSEYGADRNGDLRFREVEDDAVLKEFAEGKTVKAYRTMQVIDGKLYSPMATKVGGKATPEIKLGVPEQSEEHPEIIKGTKVGRDGIKQGYVVIDKGLGKGSLTVAYNPYAHTSRTVLNDQFSSAYIRPNLVTVEVEVPESELTSGYRAHMAKDAVGEIAWHSGSVSGQLAALGKPRRVILTRYDRPLRIVPFKEVAQMIAEQLDGTDIAIPYNVVQPQLRAELERLGVKISEEATGSVGEEPDFGKAEYITDQEIERINAHQQEMAQTSEEAKRDHAEKLAKKFNTPIRIVTDANELTDADPEKQKRMRGSKGFYNPSTGEVVVVVSNNATVEDVAQTIFHEVVAHKGLRELIGDENYDAFCDEVYDHLKGDLKQQIDAETTHRFVNEPDKDYEHHRRVAVDEMFGRLSEKGFEDFTKAERGIWAKLKAKVLEAINKFLGSRKLPKWVKLGDNELRYMLWRSHERLRGKGNYVDMARDVAKRNELGLTNELRFRDGERSVRERVSARDEYEKKVKSKGFQTKEALQNSMLGLQEFMLAIDHASGNRRNIENIPDFENPILGENRLSSVNKEEMHQVAKTLFKPLMSAVAKLSGNGKESGKLYDYMFAKHGLERDAVMRQREAQREFDKYKKANPNGTKTIKDFIASLEGKDYAGLTALTAEDSRVKSIQSLIDSIDEQMKATDDKSLLRKLGGQKKRLKVEAL